MSADTRRDPGDYYPGGKRVITTPVGDGGGDVKHSDFADVIVETNTIPKMRQAIEDLAQKLGATVAAVIAAVFVANGAGFDSVPVNDIDFDANPSVVTNVTFDGLITEHQPLTNYYSKAETDAKIVELSPPADLSSATNYTDNVATILRGEIAVATPEDYDTVKSNATVAAEAVAGLGDLAWIDGLEWSAIIDRPTTWAWSAISGKPTTWDWSAISSTPTTLEGYGITDAISRTANTLTTPGVYTEYLINPSLHGGVRIRYSSTSDANQTTYMYAGVAARRNGTTTDYLFDTTSQSGIVRRSELDDKADASVVTTLANKVDAIETWAIGDETQLRIENAGQTNATLQITYTNDLMFSTAVAESNTLAKARADATALDLALADAFDTALDGKADRAWGNTTSSGAPSPTDELIIEKPKLALTGGGNFSYIEASTGGYWVMSVSLGSEWTLESLADAQNPTNPATIAMHDAEGITAFTVTSTSSREAYTVAGEQYIYCRSVGDNDVITLTYPVVADSAPTIEFAPSLANEFATVDNWPGYIASVVPTGHSGMWTNTVTMVGHPGKGFFKAKYTKAGHTYTRFNQSIGITQITIDDVTYDISVETINGKKLMVLTEAD